jgi:hypothetical protein
MAIFRPRIFVSQLEQAICRLRRTVETFPHYRSELRMYERMRWDEVAKHRVKCCDWPRRALSEQEKGE